MPTPLVVSLIWQMLMAATAMTALWERSCWSCISFAAAVRSLCPGWLPPAADI